MATAAQYAATPATFVGSILTTSTNKRDNSGSANSVEMVAAGASGSRIDSIAFNAQAGAADVTATTAAMIYLYVGTSAAAAKLVKQISVSAVTPSTAVPSWQQLLTGLGIVLKSGQSLFGAVSVSPGVAIDFVGQLAGDL